MSKNIVLCSDGTGNSGGKGNGTNVWRIYQAVDQHQENEKGKAQIAFYDDGVGTEDNKYLRLLGGATGWGFTRNVKDLYRFLVKNYEEEDDIYLFGFSRGAYTVRALAAFVTTCGIIKFPTATCSTERDLNHAINQLVDNYHSWRNAKKTKGRAPAPDVKKSPELLANIAVHDNRKIRCIGVWDTVSAIGVPFDIGLKKLVHKLFKFTFEQNVLGDDVLHGFQALAIDDQRRSFHPEMWEPRDDVEQVWFSGVHSNVGGGYPKQGLAHVALDWMMERVQFDDKRDWGLHFDKGLRAAARHLANVHDKLYDSRAGLAAYYRYEPRDIAKLSANGKTRIHESVFERIRGRTLAYNPGNIPAVREIEVVTPGSGVPDRQRQEIITHHESILGSVSDALNAAGKWVVARKALQFVFFVMSLVIVGSIAKYAFAAAGLNSALRYAIDVGLLLAFVAILADAKSWLDDDKAVTITRWVAGIIFAAFLLFEGAWISVGSRAGEMPAFAVATIEFLSTAAGVLHPDVLLGFIADNPVATIVILVLLLVIWALRTYFRNTLAALYESACNVFRPKPPTPVE